MFLGVFVGLLLDRVQIVLYEGGGYVRALCEAIFIMLCYGLYLSVQAGMDGHSIFAGLYRLGDGLVDRYGQM